MRRTYAVLWRVLLIHHLCKHLSYKVSLVRLLKINRKLIAYIIRTAIETAGITCSKGLGKSVSGNILFAA